MSIETRDQPPAGRIILTYEEKTSVAVPDLLFVSRERLGIVTDRGVEGAPDLIIEIISSGTAGRDRLEKAQLSARHGVRHYWLVDPDAHSKEAFELARGQYQRTARVEGDATFAPCRSPGLTISLSSLWV